MDAADYRGQRFNQVLDDCAQASGKNYFVWWREEVAKLSLWYDFASSTSYSSPLRLSNVSTDVDSVLTFAISPDTELSRSPDRVNSGAYLPFDGGAVYVQNTATANSFVRRDANMPSENVKSTAKATARANRYLLEMNTEEDVITTTVQLPAAKVNFIMQGMRVQFKASHLPGYTDFVWARVLNRSVQQVSEEFYDVKMELSVVTCWSLIGEGYDYGDAPLNLTPTWDTTPAPGDVMLGFGTSSVTPVDGLPAGWVDLGQSDGALSFVSVGAYAKVAGAGETDPVFARIEHFTNLAVLAFRNVGDIGTVTVYGDLGATTSLTLTDAVADGPGFLVCAVAIHNFDTGARILTPPVGFVEVMQVKGGVGLFGTIRDYPSTSIGYYPVASAGTYDLTWTLSNTFFDWVQTGIAVFIATDGDACVV